MRTLILIALGAGLLPAVEPPFLFQQPTMNKTQIVFALAGDLWSVARGGGAATRLTTGKGQENGPLFSPDGTMVAFTGEYDGNVDVFVVPAGGGVPKRLTAHTGEDRAAGWTPDGKRVLFTSTRQSHTGFTQQLFTVPVEGGAAEALPLPIAAGGSYSPDGTQIAYLPLQRADAIWKNYRGGRATKIWIAKLADSSVTPVPRKDSNDYSPMWIGKDVYFLSDRNGGKVSLFRYDTAAKQVSVALENTGLDFKWASAGPGGIVLEQFGAIQIYDLKSGKAQPVNITLSGDFTEVRPRMEKLTRWIRSGSLSPSGARAVFEARGDIFTVPAEKGDARNITQTPGTAERFPTWSPDGKTIAYLSDAAGEYALHLAPQNGSGEVRKIGLGTPPSFFFTPVWSPDSKKIAIVDKRLNLWYIDLDKPEGAPVKVDRSTYQESWSFLSPAWSPDSKWLAYSKQLKSRYCAIHVYSVETGKTAQITDAMSDTRVPAWDPNGKYLYFTASTDATFTNGSLDMQAYNRTVTRGIYVAVLDKSEPSPLAPESDEEKSAEEKKPATGEKADEKKDGKKDEKKAVTVKIDFDGILQRTLPLPVPQRNYGDLGIGKTGMLFVLEEPMLRSVNGPQSNTLHKYDLSKRKFDKVADNVGAFEISANGEKMLYRERENYFIASTSAPVKAGEGRLKTNEIEMQIDPQAEWRQMYREVLRIERDYFYDPNHHGLDLQALGERYEKYLRGIASRNDLNYLWREMLGQLSIGHLYIMGGDRPEPPAVKGGLLGADYRIENGRYRIARIFNGENWNPGTRAPLTQPGVNVNEGDYLLAVNGRELRAADDVDAFLEGTAGKSVRLRVGADPSGTGARDVTVVPLDSESGLRRLAWIESNRRKVDQASGGKLAYLYIPDTGVQGYTYFNRYYFAQAGRQGAVIDERFNGGGMAADYIIDVLRRPLWNYWTAREGEDYTTPATAIFGPKVMLVNEYAGSGGDLLPWLFRRAGLGPVIGKRTWGGLVGIGGYPPLIDGGMVTAPHFGFWNPDGKWEVENHGTAPDIDVDLDPKAWREGRDTQLERGIEVALDLLKKNPPPVHKKPAYPVYHTKTPSAAATGGQQ